MFGIQEREQNDLSDNFWIHYDRDLRLDFRNIRGVDRYLTQLPDNDLNSTQLKEGHDAPPPVEDEAEKLRKQQLAQEKARQEDERKKMFHEIYSPYKVEGSAATLAYNNGTLITLLPNGYVMQSKNRTQRELATNAEKEYLQGEESRIITSKSLIRYLVNGKIEIMFANGNFSEYDPTTDLWTTTNNDGRRRCKRQSDGYEYDVDPIPAAVETCAETSAQVLFKEVGLHSREESHKSQQDNVISVMYPNGTRYTVHHDGTKILTNYDETEIVFEKIGYPCVKVLSGRMIDEPEKVRNMEESEAEIEFYDSLMTSRNFLKDRVKDQQIIQTYLHDKTVIQSFIEVNEFGKAKQDFEFGHHTEGNAASHHEGTGQQTHQTQEEEDSPYYQAVHLIRRQDMSVTKVTSDGEAVIITGPTRAELNKYGNLMKMGKDFDYLHELFEVRPQERKGGIFTCSLSRSKITTHDRDRNYFGVNANGTFEKVLAPELSEVDPNEEHQDHFEEGGDELDQEHHDYNINEDGLRDRGNAIVPKVNISKSRSRLANQLPNDPRIFWINVDGSGSEFFTKEKMNEEIGRFTHDVIIVKSTEFIGQNPVLMHSYFKLLKTSEEIDEEFSVVAELQSRKIVDCNSIHDLAIPKNVEEYPQMFRPLVEKPKSNVYLYKNYMQHKDFDHFKATAFQDDLSRYKKWKEDSDQACNKRFGLFEKDEDMKAREIDKRIVTKIYRERQAEKVNLGYKQIRDLRIQAVTNKLRKVKGKGDGDNIKVDEQQRRKEDQDFEDDHEEAYDEEEEHMQIAEKAPAPASSRTQERYSPRKKRTQEVIEEIAELKQEPYFVSNYFETYHGRDFLRENPPKAPNEEVLMRMSQRMSRSIGATEGGREGSQEADRLSQYTHNRDMDDRIKTGEMGSPQEMHDNAIVALEPEDEDNRDQMRMSGMKKSQMKSQMEGTLEEPNYIPSMYLQEKDFLKRKDEEILLKAEEYHVSKTKEFSVYGKLRPLKLKVKSLAKSKIKPEMNEKFITTECITDKRIKISSMANRAYLNAPSVNQVRKQGQHQMILQAISKKQTFNELISQANAMVTSVLNDPLKRSVNILPSQANFGSLKEGTKYEILITCKNEDMLPQRIVVRQATDPRIKIHQDNGGPIAAGMVKNIRVVIDTRQRSDSSVISDGFEILSKTDVYRIPITATILSSEKFNEINAESFKIHNRSAMKNTVREIYSRQKSSVNDMLQHYEHKGWIETTGSESKLPSLPNIKGRAFEPDAQKELDEVIERSSRVPSRRDSAASRQTKMSRQSKRSYRD